MKELTIEQKAQRYDEAIEKARLVLQEKGNEPDGASILSKLFPELIESEDERMVKFIKNQLFNIKKTITENYELDAKLTNAIDWLEKQGEHANFRNKIQIGDKVTRNEDGVLVNLSQLNRVAKKQGEQKPAKGAKGNDREIPFSEQEPVLIIPKFRVGDEIKTSNEESLTITKIDKKGYWSEDLFICGFGGECLWDLVEQKPAWSEEDEKMIQDIINDIAIAQEQVCCKSRCEDEINWLKSLRPQATWKPSEEQITWLYRAADDVSKDSRMKQILNELLSDLKKLRKE